ncbi:MAG: YbhB/YbcL family Raf kinase inhibitor-like protein [Gemmataceae bacterium]
MQLISTAFQENDVIPKQFTADERDVSPPLEWHDVPAGTRSLALICEDPDAPRGTFTHWVAYNLPAESDHLAEGVPPKKTLPNGAAQGINDFSNVGYGGPSPPPGKPHRYYFKLFALDQLLNLEAGTNKIELLAAMKGHVLGEAQLMGTYGR